MKQKKALFIANGILGENPGLSGGETRFIEIAKSWEELGYEIHLLSSRGGERLCNQLGLKVVLHTFSNNTSSTGRGRLMLHALKSLFFLPKTLRDFSGIVYSCNEMVFDVFPALHLKLRQGDFINWATVVHWMPPFPPWKRTQSTVLNSTLFFINERISVLIANRFADVLLAVSPMTSKQLRDWGAKNSKINTVECGVNYSQIRNIVGDIAPKHEYEAVFMKRLQAVKGIFDIIDIWELVLLQIPNAKLLIIGEGIDGEKAREIVKERRLGGSIEFAGVIYDPIEKFRKLASCKLFVLPTHEENWAIVIGEAMAAGVPVISYDLPELVDIWGDDMVSIPVHNKSAFAKMLIEMINDDAMRAIYSNKGLSAAKKYDWKEIGHAELATIMNKLK
jgi:glycosyltransferase involved in cell wall biosynthesis